MTRVLVTGATGNVGSRVVRELLGIGLPVRAFVRDPAAAVLGDGVELASGDFSDGDSVRRALEGVDAIFLACPNDPRQVAHETGVIDAAAETGVGRIVKLSALGAEAGSPLAFWDWHGKIEDHLRASRVPSVVLRPAFFMTNLLGAAEQVRREGALFAPAAGARVSMIDPRDVAAAAAGALGTDEHEGNVYTLTGPEPVSYERVAEALSAATGQRVGFVVVTDEAARQGLVEGGMPPFAADQLVLLLGMLRRGAHAQTTGDVRALTGREPRDLAGFLRENAEPFGPARENPTPSGTRPADEGTLPAEITSTKREAS